MKFIGNINSGTSTSAIQQIDDQNPEVDRIIAGSTSASPAFLTGTIKNLSLDYKMRVAFYTGRREAQEVILEPMEKLEVKHQPADRLQIQGVEPSRLYALFLYSFRSNVAESEEEVREMLYRSEFSREKLSLYDELITKEEEVERVFINTQSLENIDIVASAYEEVILKDLTVALHNFNNNVLDPTWSVEVGVIWRQNDVTTKIERIYNLTAGGLGGLTVQDLFLHLKRDISQPITLRITVELFGVSGNFNYLNGAASYFKANGI